MAMREWLNRPNRMFFRFMEKANQGYAPNYVNFKAPGPILREGPSTPTQPPDDRRWWGGPYGGTRGAQSHEGRLVPEHPSEVAVSRKSKKLG